MGRNGPQMVRRLPEDGHIMTHYPPYRDPDASTLWHILGWLLLAFVLLTAGVALGQSLPDTPRPSHGRLELSLLAADAGIRALDVYSTRQALTRGNREALLPSAIAGHAGTMAAYSAGTVALDWWATRQLERRGHRRLAHLVTLIDIGQGAPWAIHNLFLGQQTTQSAEIGLPLRLPR